MDATHITQEQADEFAIGALDPGFMTTVMLHADACRSCEALLQESQRVAGSLVMSLPRRRPPARLKRQVLRRAGIAGPGPLAWAARLVTAGAGIAAVVVAVAAFTGMVSVRSQLDDLRLENRVLRRDIDTTLPTKVELAAITRRLTDAEKSNAELVAAARDDRDLALALLSPDSQVADVISVNESVAAIGRFIWDDARVSKAN